MQLFLLERSLALYKTNEKVYNTLISSLSMLVGKEGNLVCNPAFLPPPFSRRISMCYTAIPGQTGLFASRDFASMVAAIASGDIDEPLEQETETVAIASAQVVSMSPAYYDSKKYGSVRRYLKSDEKIGQERRKSQHKPGYRHANIYRY